MEQENKDQKTQEKQQIPQQPSSMNLSELQAQQTEKLVQQNKNKVSLLILGMAGSGKTTFVQKLCQKINEHYNDPSYIMNLDPAVQFVPYTPQIDIREKIDIKKLMKSHGLGPNGGIVTAMNLYCTEIDTTVQRVQQATEVTDYVLVDTPGQIEVFTWSASGGIISSALSTTMPTVLLYIVDIKRCQNPNSFMSNMIFSLSIFYKMRLPLILVFNKEDVGDKEKVMKWMKDYEALLDSLQDQDNYLSTLSKTMVLNLDEFYQDLNCCGVSSTLGTGFEDLFPLIEKAKQEYFDITLPDILNNMRQISDKERLKQEEQLQKFKTDKEKMEEDMVNKAKKHGFDPNFNVFGAGQQGQGENQTIKDLKNKKKQMDQEQQEKLEEFQQSGNKNDVQIQEEEN